MLSAHDVLEVLHAEGVLPRPKRIRVSNPASTRPTTMFISIEPSKVMVQITGDNGFQLALDVKGVDDVISSLVDAKRDLARWSP